MKFKMPLGHSLAMFIRKVIQATVSLTLFVWVSFGLWFSWKLARHLIGFLNRVIFSSPW